MSASTQDQGPSAAAANEPPLSLSLDALVRSIGVRRTSPFAFFLGAGASTTSGIPSAQMCIWEWKRQIFLTNNPGLENQFAELSLDGVRRRIQAWLDRQGTYPAEIATDEYSFYIEQCFPIADDRRAFFQEKIRSARPHIGYQMLCHLAEADLISSVWSPNFDGLSARAAANYRLTVYEVGIDSQNRLDHQRRTGELLCVSMHGDYRYDPLMNTVKELQSQEEAVRAAFVAEAKDTSILVCGYSGRDRSLMDAFRAAYAQPGNGVLYWCGFGDSDIPAEVTDLIRHARANKRQAFYVPALGFDDLTTRLALHCLTGDRQKKANQALEQLAASDKLERAPFQIRKHPATTLIKSNAFAIECPAEVLQFDLKEWPKEKVWGHIRETIGDRPIVAVPFRGKILALGLVDDIKVAFGANIKGSIERTPVSPSELQFEDGAIVSLMREALVRSMASTKGVPGDGRHELWRSEVLRQESQSGNRYSAHASVQMFLRRVDNTQYLVIKPSIKVLDASGGGAPPEVANPIKLRILGYQHNGPFNKAVGEWRATLLGGSDATYEFPPNSASAFKFKIRRAPVFGEIGLPTGGPRLQLPDAVQPLVRYQGVQLDEPNLVFSNKAGSGQVKSPHPIRGLVENRPYDYPLTSHAFLPSLRIGVICPAADASTLHAYLHGINRTHAPGTNERDYLVDFPGFQSAYGVPIDIPEPGKAGWFTCPEPTTTDPVVGAREVAAHINRGVEALQSSQAPHVVLILFPARWADFQRYKTGSETFDVHDFVKAYCVQRGIATQFLSQETLSDQQQCRVWWWLSLALYVKGMRTPYVLEGLADNTAFVGLGFSIDPNATTGNHVVLGCSHIYSGKGEGLQYRLTKVENPIIRRGNPFMSRDDARRTGETIRQLFFDAHFKLPERVVLHKRTPFLKDEREGLIEGLSGVAEIDMIEIQIDNALRFVASVPKSDGSIDEDNYPVRRGTVMRLDDFTALVWVHGATTALHPRFKYFQGKRRIPAPLTIRRYAGKTDLATLAAEILGLSKMNWNSFDLYTRFPATLQSSNEIARIGSLLQRFGASSYDYRLFI
jgi:hypothetical protein